MEEGEMTKPEHTCDLVESFKKTETDLNTLKSSIQHIEYTLPPGSLGKKTQFVGKTSSSATLCKQNKRCPTLCNERTNLQETVLARKESCPEWLLIITEVFYALEKAFSEIQGDLKQASDRYSDETSSLTSLVANITNMSKDAEEKVQKQMGNQQVEFDQRLQTVTAQISTLTTQKDFKKAELKEINKTASTVFNELKNISQKHSEISREIQIEESANLTLDKKIKKSLENIKTNERENHDLQKQCQDFKIQVDNLKVTRINVCQEMDKAVTELIASLSNTMVEHENLQNRIPSALSQVNSFKEKLPALTDKKSQLATQFQERNQYKGDLADDISNITKCIHSYCGLKKIVQQHFQKKFECAYKTHEQLLTNLSLKQDELNHIETLCNDNHQAMIPPLRDKINQWKNALHQAIKEIETLCKQLSLLKKKKEKLHNDHKVAERTIREMKSTLVHFQESFKAKEKKWKQTKYELDYRQKVLRRQLQTMAHSILLEEMSLDALKKPSESPEIHRSELKTLMKIQNENKAKKKELSLRADNIKKTIKSTYLQMMQLKDLTKNCRQSMTYELVIAKGKQYATITSITYLKHKKDNICQGIKTVRENTKIATEAIVSTTITIAVFLDYVEKLNGKRKMLERDRDTYLNILGFRGPMVAQSVEGEAQRKNEVSSYSKKRRNVNVCDEPIRSIYTLNNPIHLSNTTVMPHYYEGNSNRPETDCQNSIYNPKEILVIQKLNDWNIIQQSPALGEQLSNQENEITITVDLNYNGKSSVLPHIECLEQNL